MKTKNRLVKSSLYLTIMIILIKLAGFIKQIVVANYYGASLDTDIFFLAYGFENSITSILFSTLQITIVLIYIDELKNKGRKASSDFISTVIMTFTPIAGVIGAIIFLMSDPIAYLIGPAYNGIAHETLSQTIKLFSVVTILNPLTTVLSSVFNAENHYIKAKISTLITNIVDIVMIVLFASSIGVAARNYAFIISNLLNAVMLYVMARSLVYIHIFKFNIDDKIRKLIRLTIPIMFGNGATIILTMIDRIISSYLDEGSVSALDYSNSIYSILISFVSTALVTVLTTYFAELAAEQQTKAISDSFVKISRIVLIPMVIICSIILCLSADVIRIVYEHGQFDSYATELVSTAVIGYVIAAIFVIVKDIAIRVLYALELTKFPFYASIIGGGINIIFSILLMRIIGVLGITLGTAIAELSATIICLIYLQKSVSSFRVAMYIKRIVPIFVGGGISFGLMFMLNRIMIAFNPYFRIIIISLFGISSYCILMKILKIPELDLLIAKIKRRV